MTWNQRTGKKRLSGVRLGRAVGERGKRCGNETGMTEVRKDKADSMKRR